MANTGFVGGFNIQEFKSKVESRGILKNNKFMMGFNLPQKLRATLPAILTQNVNDLRFWCDGASIPGLMLSLRQILRYGTGAIEKKPVAPVFNDITFSIMADGASVNLEIFQQWIMYVCNCDFRNGPSDQSTTFELRYKQESDGSSNYTADMNVVVFDNAGKPSLNIVFREAYPIHIGDIPLNWADNGNIQRVPVTFTFCDWYDFAIKESTPLDLSDVPTQPLK